VSIPLHQRFLQVSTLLVGCASSNGTYQAPVTLPQGISPGFTAVGDFNGDGKLDFAAWPSGSQVSVYLGNGNGTFQAAKILSDSTYSGEYCDGIVAADMNHDGKTDLVEIILVPGHGDSVQLWISNGNGAFTAGQRSSGAVGGFGTFAGDFDGDGNRISLRSSPTKEQPPYRSGMATARDMLVLHSRSPIRTIMTTGIFS
jgi:hypothetical protein